MRQGGGDTFAMGNQNIKKETASLKKTVPHPY